MTINQVEETRYNVRNRVPDFLDIFQKWREQSEAFRTKANMKSDIRYGQGEKATLDLFFPEDHSTEKPVALHLFIHGGYWQAMDKSDFSYLAEPFVQENIAVAIVNYDLCPEVTLFEIVDQIRQALIWVATEGQNFGLDPDNIQISGHSAGGHLLGEILATEWQGKAPRITSAIALSGLFDLVPLVDTSINEKVGLNIEGAKHLSPLGKPCTSNCPTLAAYGEAEGDGFEMQSLKMVDHWQNEGLVATSLRLENATHFDICDALADKNSAIFKWTIEQFG